MKKLNFQHLWQVIKTYPLVVISAFLFYFFVWSKFEYREMLYDSLGIIFSSAISLFYGLNMMSRKIGKPWLLRGIGILLLLVYFYILPYNEIDYDETTAYLVLPIYILLHLFVAVAQNMVGKESMDNFWTYNKNLFINFAISLIFSGVLVVGVLSVLGTCDELFNLNIRSDVYIQMGMFIGILGNTFIFLLFDYKTHLQENEPTEYPIILKFFTQYVLIPIMILYTIVLYLYSIKILLTWELPKGWLSYGIISYSIVGILALLLVYPLRDKTQKSWVKWFYKLFFISLLPLLLLLFVAIFSRISAYGFTEPRYYVLGLGIWLTICTLYFIFYKKAAISFIPKSLIVITIVALAFPYFNAFSVAIRSQQNEFKNLLIENNLIKDGKIDYSAKVDLQLLHELNEKIDFLKIRESSETILTYYDAKKVKKFKDKGTLALNYDDFTHVTDSQKYESPYKTVHLENSLVEIKDNNYIWTPSAYTIEPAVIGTDTIEISKDNKSISIVLNNQDSINLYGQIYPYVNRHSDEFWKLNNKPFSAQLGDYIFTMYLQRVTFTGAGNINTDIQYVLIKPVD